ncbi:hypothetical protein [Sphingobacterium spiritivorum]|uniref:hypothetical protein n=1 Tax=Sphingobacterium spiritivorum TaxID=258 RepID=UPI0019193A36|nr:hypothetical protein [Sphingobacterium spiritivorum]QQT25753.1 hypothetical protein I6J02_18870 [Sphingobacterium spiritivorum]
MQSIENINTSRSLSAKLLALLYILILIYLGLILPSENDQFLIPVIYLGVIAVLQFSFVAYYRPRFKSAAVIFLILLIVLLSLFAGFLYYISGLAAAYKN